MGAPKITVNTQFEDPSDNSIKHPRPTDSRETMHSRVHDYQSEARETLEAAGHHNDSDQDELTNNSLFKYTPDQLLCLVDPKNAYVLGEMGGIHQLARDVHTDLDSGLTSQQLHGNEMNERVAAYGENRIPERKPKTLIYLMWQALQDKVLIILSVAAVISLALGLYQTFGQPPELDDEGRPLPQVEWVEGVAILVAVTIVVVVGAVNDWQKERQFMKLNKKKDNRVLRVLRDGSPTEISVFDLVVGDLLMVEPGDMIPADGVLVRGFDIKCDESSASGESDTLRKHPAEVVIRELNSNNSKDDLSPHAKKLDAFMLSGAKVLEGTGVALVTGVGPHSMHGKTLMSLHEDSEATPLQEKLNRIAEGIAKLGFAAAIILFIALMIRFFAKLPGSTKSPSEKGAEFMKIFITAITIIVVAVPEGLPLAVTLALAFATTRMVKDNNLVRVLKSCETMGGATTICSDKTGTLTQNKMTVVRMCIGGEEPKQSSAASHMTTNDTSQQLRQSVESFSPELRQLIFDSIALNSSAFEAKHGDEPFVGSKTETALLQYAAEYMDLNNLGEIRKGRPMVQVVPFDSGRKYMASIEETQNSEGYICYVKGASEVVLGKCTSMLDPSSFQERELNPEDRDQIMGTIDEYANNSLRTIGIAYCKLPNDQGIKSQADVDIIDPEKLPDLTFISLFGIKDPLRPGVRQSVADCKRAGVTVRMVTGDNINTARAIAKDCGILVDEQNDIVMEGPQFRKLDAFDLRKVAPHLRVLARSSPQDKRKLVKTLKSMGETVAVTGDGTNDAPALKLADIGFSMGIAGTEVAKEASDVILMDDNFGSIVNAIKWGRTVNDAVKKFLQFQLTVNVTAVLLTFVSAVSSSDNTSVLSAVQLLWVNLIMDTLAALALATDPPVDSVLDRMPDSRKKSLITPTMWKLIFGQAIMQLIVTFVLFYAGPTIFNIDRTNSHQMSQVHALVFNTFVWMQFFNMIVNRRLDNKQNILEGASQNWYFIVIMAIIGGIQVLIMFVGGAAFSVERQTGAMWGTAIICGLLSIPWGMVLRCIPDAWLVKLWPARFVAVLKRLCRKMSFRKTPNIEVVEEEADEHVSSNARALPSQYVWNPAIEQVRKELEFLKTVRGGRLSQLNFRPRSIYESWKEALSPNTPSTPVTCYSSGSPSLSPPGDSPPRDFLAPPPNGDRGRGYSGSSLAAMTMVPMVVGGAIGGWSVKSGNSDNEGTKSVPQTEIRSDNLANAENERST